MNQKWNFLIFLKKSHFLTVVSKKIPRPEKRENSPKKFENLLIWTNFSYIL
jgi:hypothetical protein